ncbi:hypothetical protein PROFUN_15240 [Planoprotostelium fungivorum]|uniref:Uncharacterized protein n=1 Tax=Planoprotostelium fungivorum TaxID=1890364 RepID=A0A2P6MXK7_9EUKA|nr:hypothetical protein PROFUN_15240 [Planoprotostelium fungivorum]
MPSAPDSHSGQHSSTANNAGLFVQEEVRKYILQLNALEDHLLVISFSLEHKTTYNKAAARAATRALCKGTAKPVSPSPDPCGQQYSYKRTKILERDISKQTHNFVINKPFKASSPKKKSGTFSSLFLSWNPPLT